MDLTTDSETQRLSSLIFNCHFEAVFAVKLVDTRNICGIVKCVADSRLNTKQRSESKVVV